MAGPAERGQSPPCAPFWETSKPRGAQRRCLCSLAVRIKARGGRARKAQLCMGRPAPEPGDAQHHPELPPPPCSHGIPTGASSTHHGHQPIVCVSMCPQGWDRDAQHHPQGLKSCCHPRVTTWGQQCSPHTRAIPGFGISTGT